MVNPQCSQWPGECWPDGQLNSFQMTNLWLWANRNWEQLCVSWPGLASGRYANVYQWILAPDHRKISDYLSYFFSLLLSQKSQFFSNLLGANFQTPLSLGYPSLQESGWGNLQQLCDFHGGKQLSGNHLYLCLTHANRFCSLLSFMRAEKTNKCAFANI